MKKAEAKKKLAEADRIAIDVENNIDGYLLCFAVATDEEAWFFSGDDIDVLEGLEDKKFIGHNIQHDRRVIKDNGGIVIDNVDDTMILSQMVYNGFGYKHNLAEVANRELGVFIDKTQRESFKHRTKRIFSKEDELYTLGDIEYLFKLRDVLFDKIVEADMEEAYRLEMAVLPAIGDIVPPWIDVEGWKKLVKTWKVDSLKLKEQLVQELLALKAPLNVQYDMFGPPTLFKKGVEFNFDSPAQIKWLFSVFNVVIPEDKYGDATIRQDILSKYNTENPSVLSKFINIYVEYKKKQKLITSFGDNMLNSDRLPSRYGQCFTDTARLNSKDFNLQNIPSRSEEGKQIRKCFISPPGYVFITCDMAGAELRIGAALSKDPLLIASFTEGIDVHSELATASYRIISGDPTAVIYKDGGKLEEFRDLHKQVNFGLMYGASARRISEVLSIPESMAKDCLRAISLRIPVLSSWLREQVETNEAQGFIVGNGITRRRRYKATATEACNFPVQTTNADAMKLALVNIRAYIHQHALDAFIVNTVHDEVCVVMNESQVEAHPTFVKDIMANSLQQFLLGIVPGSASQTIGKHWKK